MDQTPVDKVAIWGEYMLDREKMTFGPLIIDKVTLADWMMRTGSAVYRVEPWIREGTGG